MVGSPPADRLSQGQAGRHHVEALEDRESPSPRQGNFDHRPGDQPAVDGEPAFPDGNDLPRVLSVVVPVEQHLVEARPEEACEHAPLGNPEKRFSGKALGPTLALGDQ
jgi:hypothetical protein